jgi:quercetin dioxygenase-like cupin family protein
MAFDNVAVKHWEAGQPPTESAILALISSEKLQAYRWANGPGDIYHAHTHTYNKVIYVVRGTITFGLPALRSQLFLEAGDRLELPAGVSHDAKVGPEGVTCLEAHC